MQYSTAKQNLRKHLRLSRGDVNGSRPQLKTTRPDEESDIDSAGKVNGTRFTLPYLATAGDLREVVQFLKRKPEGASLVEAMDALRKRLFDPRKVFAYEFWGIVTRKDGRLHLSSLGWEFAERFVPEAEAYRSVIARTPLYHSSIVWIFEQGHELVTHLDMGRLWRENEGLEIGDEEKLESYASSFFHLCHAADVGMLIMGRKGQPTRLRTYPEELEAYIQSVGKEKDATDESSVGSRLRAYRHAWQQPLPASPIHNLPRVLVSHGGDVKAVERILEMLELVGLPFDVIERNSERNLPLSDQTIAAIQRCNIGAFLLCSEDFDASQKGICGNGLLIEIGAAFVHFDRRVILVFKGNRSLPPDLQQLQTCRYESDVTWEVAVELARKIRTLRREN